MPPYPSDAIREGKTGVAVAEIEIDESGRTVHVIILEAPAPSIGDSLKRVLSKWQFEPFQVSGRPAIIRGKLTFYFLIRDGNPKVFNTDNAPYVGRWPEHPIEKPHRRG